MKSIYCVTFSRACMRHVRVGLGMNAPHRGRNPQEFLPSTTIRPADVPLVTEGTLVVIHPLSALAQVILGGISSRLVNIGHFAIAGLPSLCASARHVRLPSYRRYAPRTCTSLPYRR